MSIIRLVALNIFFALFLVLMSLSLANAEGIHIGPIAFHPGVSLDWHYDDNYLYSETNKKGAYYLNVDPSFGISYDRGGNKFNLDIRSPVRYFSEAKAPDEKTKYQETFYTANASISLPWKSYLKVYDSFTSTELSPFLTEEKPPRPDSLENHARFTFGTALGELLKLEGDYRNDLYKRKDRDEIHYSVDNRKVDNIRGTVIFSFLASDSILADYSYRTDKFTNNPARDLKSWQYDFGLLHRFRKFLNWSGRIGFSKTTGEGGIEKNIFVINETVPGQLPERSKTESDTFVWGQTLDLKITDKTSMNFSVSKSVTDSFSANKKTSTNKSLSMFFDFKSSLTDRTDVSVSGRRTVNTTSKGGGDTIFNDLDLNISQKFFERIFLSLNGSYGLNEFKGRSFGFASKSRNKDERWNGGGNLSFKIFKHATTGISFEHEKRRSDFGNYSKNITSLNMQISF